MVIPRLGLHYTNITEFAKAPNGSTIRGLGATPFLWGFSQAPFSPSAKILQTLLYQPDQVSGSSEAEFISSLWRLEHSSASQGNFANLLSLLW